MLAVRPWPEGGAATSSGQSSGDGLDLLLSQLEAFVQQGGSNLEEGMTVSSEPYSLNTFLAILAPVRSQVPYKLENKGSESLIASAGNSFEGILLLGKFHVAVQQTGMLDLSGADRWR